MSDERQDFADHYGLDPETLPPRLADARVVGVCRICELPEERHGLCPGHREEWIRWASHRPDQQNDEGFDDWIGRRVAEMNGADPSVIRATHVTFDSPLGWLCEECHWFTEDEAEAGRHCDEKKHSLARCPVDRGRLLWMTSVMEGVAHFASGRAGVIATEHLIEQGVWSPTVERDERP